MLDRKLKMGLIGGGPGSFIGIVHIMAATLDGKAELVAGAFSRNPQKSEQRGKELYLNPNRVYSNYQEMIEKESRLPEGKRIDFVAITTPNDSHFSIARDFIHAGFHVMCDKPLTFNVAQAKELKKIVDSSDILFGLTHNYTGYPMVKLARDVIRDGDLGNIRKIVVQYPQGWLYTPLEKTDHMQAGWRSDPLQSGAAGSIGDIGTHAENLTEYLTGLKITQLCADLNIFVEDRKLDDDGNCLLRFDNGANGVLHVSQVAVGEENNFAIWIYGDKKSLEWRQEDPNYLPVKQQYGPTQVWRRGNDYIGEKSPAAGRASRLPFGHTEGFIEAFANIYLNYCDTLSAKLSGEKPDPLALDFPGIDDGVRGMLFIESVVKSAKSNAKWTEMLT